MKIVCILICLQSELIEIFSFLYLLGLGPTRRPKKLLNGPTTLLNRPTYVQDCAAYIEVAYIWQVLISSVVARNV
jgi:hypothetical protein